MYWHAAGWNTAIKNGGVFLWRFSTRLEVLEGGEDADGGGFGEVEGGVVARGTDDVQPNSCLVAVE